MRKEILLLMCILLLSSVFALKVEQKDITKIDKIAKIAEVNNSKGYISQYPYELKKGDKAIINLDTKGKGGTYTVCFDFKGQDDLVNITSFGREVILGLKQDLKKIKKLGKYLCMKSVSLDSDSFEFEADYFGVGRLKYDIYIPELDLTLDPYLIGNLSEVQGMLLHLAFEGNITDLSDDDQGKTEYTNLTFVYIPDTSLVYYDPILNISDFHGLISGNVYVNSTSEAVSNEYIKVEFHYSDGTNENSSAISHIGTTGAWVNGFSHAGTSKQVDNITVWAMANTGSNHYIDRVSFNYTRGEKNTHAVVNKSLEAMYFLDFGTSEDYANNNDGVDTLVQYNNGGGVFDGSSSWINATTDLSIGENNESFAVFIRAKRLNKGILQSGLVGTGGGGWAQGYLIDWRNNSIWCEVSDGSGSGAYCNTDSDVAYSDNSSFHTIVLNVVTNSSGKWADIYFDGVLKKSSDISAEGDLYLTDATTHIGKYKDPVYFNGTISEVVFFNTSLLPQEISFLHNASYTEDVKGIADSAINFSELNQYIKVEPTDNYVATSFWYNNGSWHNVINNSNTYYVDGVVSSKPSDYPLIYNSGFELGKTSSGYFNGSVDELLVYNYVLSSDEIQYLADGFNNSLNITFYDAESLSLLSGESITLDIYEESSGFSTTKTTSDGTLLISGIPSGEIRLNYYSANYDGNTLYKTLSSTNDLYHYSLYLTNSTSGDIKDVLLHVLDSSSLALEGAKISIYAQNTSSGEFYDVTEAYSNINGEALVQLVLDSTWYKFTITYNGAVCYTTQNSFLITSVDDNIYFTCNSQSSYINIRDKYNAVSMSFSAINNSNLTGYFTLVGNSTNTTYFCVDVVASSGSVDTLYNRSCVNSTTALLTVNVNASNYTSNVRFTGTAKYIPYGESHYSDPYIRSLVFDINAPLNTGLTGIFFVGILLIIGLVLLVKIPEVGVVYFGAVTFFVTIISEMTRFKLLPLSSVSTTASVGFGSGVLALSIIIAFAISKRGSE